MHLGTLDRVPVFEHDPGLLDGLPPESADVLRRRVFVQRTWTRAGTWQPGDDEAPAGHLGLLVLDGLLVRTVGFGGRACSEVVGAGDLLRPWDGQAAWSSVACGSTWHVLLPASFAALDVDFARQAGRFPTVMAQLMARTTLRARNLVHQAAIAQVRHAETRILLALWGLADRWGCVTPQGVRVPVPLTHRLLSQLTCLQRPTVTSAVRNLTQEGALSRTEDRGWLLHGEPPSPASIETAGGPGRRLDRLTG